jgi:hypothetical protein
MEARKRDQLKSLRPVRDLSRDEEVPTSAKIPRVRDITADIVEFAKYF